ncbi:ABC transporter substrate-binding protein [Sporolactobacillus sp. THM19-2]|uniref:ABC transporter substrate-binding protein n=1 Tax=Sporolactobacillus sp. THM19-2 TaxID=2511171 RepID=UPI00101F1E55|nr:ABC transporter substrate-binding protein [Sporolactobacillus sp. THM19-2]RYL93983.1 ABC transporter substrate-binding protein [Sporolactobacillus sp. THM19-2]
MRLRLKSFLILSLTFLLVIVSGCGSNNGDNGESATGTTKKQLVIGLDNDPPQLDPQKSSAAVDRQVYQSIYNSLVDIDKNGKIVPELATSWKISKDGKTYTFDLRKDVKFHDGTAFNAEAVKFNFERELDPKMASPRLSEIGLISKVTVLDDYRVQLTLKQPFSPLLAILTDRSGMMLSPTAVKKEGENFSNHPVGTGPYQFVERVKQDHITVKAFKDYWGGKPKTPTIVYRPFADGNVRLTNLTSGNLDLVNTVDYKDIDTVKKNSNLKIDEKDAIGFQGLVLNVHRAPLDNVKVRQAINLAIDRKSIAKVIFHNYVTPATSPIPAGSWAHDSSIKVPDGDVTEAKQLIKESGLKNIHFTLKIPSGSAQNQQLGQMIQSMLKNIGITVKLEMVEFGTMIQQGIEHNFDAINIGWSGRIDPDGTIYSWFITNGGNNDMGYSNPQVDKWLNQARSVTSQKERTQLYHKISQQLWKDAPYISIYYPNDFKAMKKNVDGFVHYPDTMIRPDTISSK